MKQWLLGILTFVMVIGLSACTSRQPTTSNVDEQPDTPSNTSSSGREIKIEAFNYGFTPNTIEVAKGEKVSFVITNKGGFHDFMIKDLNISQGLSTSAPTKVDFSTDTPGTYEFICSVGNHASLGMKGTIVVK